MSQGDAPQTTYDVCYWVDDDDRIVAVSDAWERFALENGGNDLGGEQVVGRHLLSFIRGDTTRLYMSALLQAARLLGRPLVRPYRCDSPELRREMEMHLSREESGLLRVEHRVVRTAPLQRRLDFAEATGPTLHVRCSMCNRLKVGDTWKEPDDASAGVPARGVVPVVYGVCEGCSSAP